MTDLNVNETLAERLRENARLANQSVDEFLELLLNRYLVSQAPESLETGQVDGLPPNALGRLAATAREMTFTGGTRDIARRSREILDAEFADDLMRRIGKRTNE